MTASLFVDCDDTLIMWLDEYDQPKEGQNPYGGGSQRWRVNEGVRAGVLKWRKQNPRGEIVIWSGGGVDYARRWGWEVLPATDHIAHFKDPRIPRRGDVVVDDAELKTLGTLLTPQQFIEVMRAPSAEGRGNEDTKR